LNSYKYLAVVSRNNRRLTQSGFPATLRAMPTPKPSQVRARQAEQPSPWFAFEPVLRAVVRADTCSSKTAHTAETTRAIGAIGGWMLVATFACSSAMAAPAAADAPPSTHAPDVLGELLQDRGLLGQAAQAGQRMGERVGKAASELVVHAMGFLGVPYKLGGQSVETGFDCSGFVRAVYEQTLGLVLPRTAHQQATSTQTIAAAELRPGDLVFFNTLRRSFSHVGIYIGEGRFIHSPRPGAEVRVENMKVNYWSTRFDGARRVVAAQPADAAYVDQSISASVQPRVDGSANNRSDDSDAARGWSTSPQTAQNPLMLGDR
jgi:cell wall-associated NlpC family hydrolase